MDALSRAMRDLENAEDLLDYFAIPYDRAVAGIGRPYLLERFEHDLAARGGIENLDPASAYATCRQILAQVYTDFVVSSGIDARIFRMLRPVDDAPVARRDG